MGEDKTRVLPPWWWVTEIHHRGNKGLCKAHVEQIQEEPWGQVLQRWLRGTDSPLSLREGGPSMSSAHGAGGTVSDIDGADSRGRGSAEPSQSPTSWKAGVAVECSMWGRAGQPGDRLADHLRRWILRPARKGRCPRSSSVWGSQMGTEQARNVSWHLNRESQKEGGTGRLGQKGASEKQKHQKHTGSRGWDKRAERQAEQRGRGSRRSEAPWRQSSVHIKQGGLQGAALREGLGGARDFLER